MIPKDGGNAEPGPLRISRTPYMRQILRDACNGRTQYIDIMKGVQVAGSKATEIIIGHNADVHGDDAIVVFPTQAIAEERLKKRFVPMFKRGELARHMGSERYAVSKDSLQLNHCTIYPAWPSASALASRSVRVVILDEIDKYPSLSHEAECIDLADARTSTFQWRRLVVRISTPTSKTRGIARVFDLNPNKRRWHVPCPCCGALILLDFAQVSWPGQGADDHRELLAQMDALQNEEIEARYTCQQCGGDFGEPERLAIQQQGEWVQDGLEPGDLPDVVSVAYHIPSINSPWKSFSDMAVEYLRSEIKGDPVFFVTNFLGMPYEESGRELSESLFHERADHTPLEVPEWATCVTAGADTQKDHWWYVVRAWGPNEDGLLQSKLLDFGKALSVADLRAKTVDSRFPVAGRSGFYVSCRLLYVDSGGGVENLDGTTRDTVYQMALADPHRIFAIKGHGGTNAPDQEIRISPQRYLDAKAGPQSVKLAVLDTQGLKDQISDLIHADPARWFENAHVDDEYASHMAGEVKTLIESGRRMVMRWQPKRQGRHVDLWDASVYCLAAAKSLRALKRAPEFQQQVRQAPQPMARPVAQSQFSNWIARRPRGR